MDLRQFMNVNQWDEMNRLHDEFNRLFTEMSQPSTRAFPAVNIWTKEDQAIITAELPGYSNQDIELTILNDELTLKGRRQKEPGKENEFYHRQERRFGEFSRTIRLPFMADTKNVEANLQDGMLNINLVRAEIDKPRKIEIKTT